MSIKVVAKQNHFRLGRIVSNFAHKLSRLSSLNPESFVAKCLTRI